MMVDFMDRDDQQMVNIQRTILRKAALHHLHIQFHGAYKPTGLIRTWPNEFTREGTLNYENDKWGNPITPDDDLNVVFTRLIAGATDYHLGGFRAVPAAEYKPHFVHPLVLGTRCHMLAMYVVLESYLPMVCDNPEAYEGADGFDFIKTYPPNGTKPAYPLPSPMNGRLSPDERELIGLSERSTIALPATPVSPWAFYQPVVIRPPSGATPRT